MAQREHDVSLFFDATTKNEKRIAILKRYNDSHIFIAPENTPENVMKFLTFVGSVRLQENGHILVKLDDLLSRDEDRK